MRISETFCRSKRNGKRDVFNVNATLKRERSVNIIPWAVRLNPPNSAFVPFDGRGE